MGKLTHDNVSTDHLAEQEWNNMAYQRVEQPEDGA